MLYGPTQGIVLQSIPYGDHDRIVTLLTQEHGLVTILVKRASSKRLALHCLCTPLTLGEWVWKQGKGELHSYREGKVIHTFPLLRKQWRHLELAGSLLKKVRSSQLPGLPTPNLYTLLIGYLQLIPQAPRPELLFLSFTLKLAKQEGTLHWETTCHCGCSSSFWHEGSSLCSSHAPKGALFFAAEDREGIFTLMHSRSKEEILNVKLSGEGREKIEEILRKID